MVDASLGEIMTTCEKITWLLDEGEKWLKPEYRLEPSKLLVNVGKITWDLKSLLTNVNKCLYGRMDDC